MRSSVALPCNSGPLSSIIIWMGFLHSLSPILVRPSWKSLIVFRNIFPVEAEKVSFYQLPSWGEEMRSFIELFISESFSCDSRVSLAYLVVWFHTRDISSILRNCHILIVHWWLNFVNLLYTYSIPLSTYHYRMFWTYDYWTNCRTYQGRRESL